MSQFDSNFTKQTPVDSPCGASLSESVNLVFQVELLRSNGRNCTSVAGLHLRGALGAGGYAALRVQTSLSPQTQSTYCSLMIVLDLVLANQVLCLKPGCGWTK